MPFRRKRRQLMGKAYEKHSDTLISIIGPGTATVSELLVRDSEVGARQPSGATDTIQLGRGNNEECNTGDICKFVNLQVMVAPRSATTANIGWLEWAFCIVKNVDPSPLVTNKGTNTLGDICTKYLRNQCIFTGAIPVGNAQPAVAVISLKIPKSRQRLVQGDEWKLFFWSRTTSSTETSTDMHKVITSFNYKNYH